MQKPEPDKSPVYILTGLVLLFVLGRFLGAALFDNGWSFNHWRFIDTWYIAVWFFFATALAFFLGRFFSQAADFFCSRLRLGVAGLVLMALFVFFQYDSFLFVGGNIRVQRIAQLHDVVFRWFQFGLTLTVFVLDRFYDTLGLEAERAGVWAWKTLAFFCTALSLRGAWQFAVELADDRRRRFGLFVLCFFGPQFLLYFGLIGVGPVIVALTIWTSVAAVRVLRSYTLLRLGLLWGLVALGLFLHVGLVYLLPGTVFATIAGARRENKKAPAAALVFGLAVWIALIALTYILAADRLYMARDLLFLNGKNPFADYGLISGRHLGDMLQVLFLLFPLLVLAKYLFLGSWRDYLRDRIIVLLGLFVVSGFTAAFLIDPSHGIVLDLPRLAAFLTPGALLLAALFDRRLSHAGSSSLGFRLAVAAAIVLPLSYLPAYVHIRTAEDHATAYLDRHTAYYRTAAVALRDAYFYRKDLERANYWDQSYVRKSPDYLDFQGISEFAAGGMTGEALNSLTKLIVRNPYWADARALYARIQMDAGRPRLAGPHIDTAIMLEPYNRVHRINQYSYLRQIGEDRRALRTTQEAATMFPHDTKILQDLMLLHYRNGEVLRAEQLADSLLAADSTLPQPHLIKAFLYDRSGRLELALREYERFADLAPDDPQITNARKRANALYLQLQDSKGPKQ